MVQLPPPGSFFWSFFFVSPDGGNREVDWTLLRKARLLPDPLLRGLGLTAAAWTAELILAVSLKADVCHAYHVLHSHGIPDSRIIVMMYDDIAKNEENPTPGIVINHPSGMDVYRNVPRDYVGEAVTPEIFMAVLLGNESAVHGRGSGKVVKSSSNDHIFINFVDHGADGILAFPASELTVKELIGTLNQMNAKKSYAKMVLYIEACESGSMFREHLAPNINIYATTASDFNESSYACYYDDQRQTFLGDWYSVNWMEDSDTENLQRETLYQQFQIIKKETNTSHVMEYGDISISKMSVAEFQGLNRTNESGKRLVKPPYDAVPSLEVPLEILFRRLRASKNENDQSVLMQRINEMITSRRYAEDIFKQIVQLAAKDSAEEAKILRDRNPITDIDCHHRLVKSFSSNCFNFGKNPYALKFAYMLNNMCSVGVAPELAEMAMRYVCHNLSINTGIQ